MTFSSLYVSRPLLNGDEVARHFVDQGLRSTLDSAEMHITVVYSRQPLQWEKVPLAEDELILPPMRGARGTGKHAVDRQVEKLGEHGVIVLILSPLQSEEGVSLIRRWQEYRNAGASHDYANFTAHITVSYAGDEIDVSNIKPFPGILRFGPEVRKPIKTDWKPDMTKETPAAKSDHFGHRDNPVVVDAPYKLDRACARVWDPTPDQASAGNYKMAHAVIGGLPVTIETPRGRMRHGAGEDGKPWSVQMPAHYGFFKRTLADDGDQVDVYVGPEAHRAAELPVWIVDQCDKDTLLYDEPKTFVGFPDRRSAHRTYLGAFSDGKGQHRIGGVARMTFDAFRAWLSSDRTKKPVVMRKSASLSVTFASYGPPTCDCNGTSGVPMDKTAAKTETSGNSATGLGKIMAFMSKGMSRLSPTEQAEVLAEAGLMAKSELTKASESLTRHDGEMSGVSQFEDQWDGPPDDHLEVSGGHGPGSTAAPR